VYVDLACVLAFALVLAHSAKCYIVLRVVYSHSHVSLSLSSKLPQTHTQYRTWIML